jgi:hypothetical protein
MTATGMEYTSSMLMVPTEEKRGTTISAINFANRSPNGVQISGIGRARVDEMVSVKIRSEVEGSLRGGGSIEWKDNSDRMTNKK